MTDYREHRFRSADGGLELFARDYPGANGSSPTLLLMHALTRNSADFEPMIDWLAGTYRLVVPDVRGRGLSGRDPEPMNYRPDVYAADMFALMDDLGIKSAGLIGTSMGGLIAMAMTAIAEGGEFGQRIGPVVLNDVGAHIEPDALERIGSYVGKSKGFAGWDEAAATVRRINGPVFPDFTDKDWMDFARRTCQETGDGVAYAYDPAIAVPFAGESEKVDLWPIWQAMGTRPVLVVRGEMSDLLSAETVAEMGRCHEGPFAHVDVPQRGHTPLLDEPAARAAIETFLKEHYPA
ncbi:alpha/beta fold hydrolase [Croceicoccus mobilis]|uniref:Alpha/beta hydrolase n=1 Tax=Croceicoccus mobilis TaxID=1703339 RepID=A0A916Z717_9SPHN|nr:alpha/beta hydrolase [Croceicoccus mobilis]GGD79674.1 alpha/beta hydrolase [Croceicoccus mobilis]